MEQTPQQLAEQAANLLPEDLQDKLSDVRDEIENVDMQVRRVVGEHPFLTLFGALAGGYLLGRLIARR